MRLIIPQRAIPIRSRPVTRHHQLLRHYQSSQRSRSLLGIVVTNNLSYFSTTSSTTTNTNRSTSTSTTSTTSNTSNTTGVSTEDQKNDKIIKLRVAIVGGGVAGLSTALHLAPLASAGLISSPIHIYESATEEDPFHDKNYNKASSTSTNNNNSNNNSNNNDIYSGSGCHGRDVGVGIWSSAVSPFTQYNHRQSHSQFLNHIQEKGRWVNQVGYRTPDGSWLAQSNLSCGPSAVPNEGDGAGDDNDDGDDNNNTDTDPALLFLKERDLLKALRDAVACETELYQTIQTHYANKEGCQNGTVEGVLAHYDRYGDELGASVGLGRLVFGSGSMSKDMYHMIVDASGTVSIQSILLQVFFFLICTMYHMLFSFLLMLYLLYSLDGRYSLPYCYRILVYEHGMGPTLIADPVHSKVKNELTTTIFQ